MFKRKVSVASLQSQSDKIVDVFTKTIDDLSAVNEEANALTVEKTAEIQKLETEVEVLQDIQTKNQTVINKIQKIFE